MKRTVGLSNIGKRSKLTRYSIGFEAADYILKKNNLSLDKQEFKDVYTVEQIDDDKVLSIEPMTMMNLSGEAVVPIMDYCNVSPEDLIVLYDDLDLEQGQACLRRKGSAGGHNGIKSIIKMLGADQFKHIRVGMGRSTNGMTVPDYVSQRFSNDEAVTMEKVIEHAARAIEKFAEISRFGHVVNEFSDEMK